MPAGSEAWTEMVSAFPRTPDSTAWCESWGGSPSSNTCACSSVVDDFFEAVLDFFFLLRFADFEDFEDLEDFELLLEDFLLDFFFFFAEELEDVVEESEEGALASVCAIAPAVKQSAAAAATQ